MDQLPIEVLTLILHHVCTQDDTLPTRHHQDVIPHYGYLQVVAPWMPSHSTPHIKGFSHLSSPLRVNKRWNIAATRLLYSHIQLDNDLSFLLLARLFSPHSSLLKTLWSDVRLATQKRLVSLQRDGVLSFLSHLSSDSVCICSSLAKSIFTGSTTAAKVWKMSGHFLPFTNQKWIEYYSPPQPNKDESFMPVQDLSYLPDVWKSKNPHFVMTHIYGTFVTEICLHAISAVTDEKFIPLISHCPHIQSVDVSLCHNLTDVGIQALARHCKQLKKVALGGLPSITPSSLHELARFHKNTLTCLDIRACPKLLFDDNILSLSTVLQSSRQVGCVGGHALAECLSKLKHLAHVYIGNVPLTVSHSGEIIEKEQDALLPFTPFLPKCIPVLMTKCIYLTTCHLSGLPIHDDMGAWMVSVLATSRIQTKSLSLCLDFCPIGNKTMAALDSKCVELQLKYLSIKGCTLIQQGESLHHLVRHHHVQVIACQELNTRFLL